jgi:hypothetical protein
VSQENEIVDLDLFKKFKKNQLSDHGKIVYGYHLLRERKVIEAKKVLASVSVHYYSVDIHKDIARALLCWATYMQNQDPNLGKESEFYTVMAKLTRMVVTENLLFTNSGYFHELSVTLFKGFTF